MDFIESINNVYNNSIKSIQDSSGKLLLTHLGEMKPDTITNLSEKAESKLFEINAPKKNIKNIFQYTKNVCAVQRQGSTSLLQESLKAELEKILPIALKCSKLTEQINILEHLTPHAPLQRCPCC